MMILQSRILRFFLVGLLVMATSSSFAHGPKYFILSSGSPNTPYFQTANDIANYLNDTLVRKVKIDTTRQKDTIEVDTIIDDRLRQYVIRPVNSEGSLDNLKRFKNGLTEFLIVQRDATVNAYYKQNQPIKNLTIILPLFPEALQIFVKGGDGKIDFETFKQKVENGSIDQIGIGPPNSSTNQTTRKVLNLLGVTTENSLFNTSPPSDYIDSFVNGESVDAFAFLASPPINQLQNKEVDFSILELSHHEIETVTSHLTKMNEVKFDLNRYGLDDSSGTISSVGTWAFLAGNPKSIQQIEEKGDLDLSKYLFEKVRKEKNNIHLERTFSKANENLALKVRENGLAITGSNETYSTFFKGLPVHSNLQDLFENSNPWRLKGGLGMILILIVVVVLMGYFLKKVDLNLNKYVYRYKHFLFGALFLIAIYLLISPIIYFLETEFSKEYAFRSPILNLSLRELHIWLMRWIFAGYNADIFPISLGAQFLVTASMYLGLATVGSTVIFEFIFSQTLKKRKQGMSNYTKSDQFVICGWNDKAYNFLDKTADALENYAKKANAKRELVVINTLLKDQIEKDEKLERDVSSGKFHYIYGEPTEEKVLDKANVKEAKTVILLADDKSQYADEKTLLRAMAVSRYCRSYNDHRRDSIYLVAEVNNPKFKSTLLENDVNEVVCTGDMANDILVQSALNHGVSNMLQNLLEYNQRNEFFTIDLRNFPSLVNHNFSELFNKLREYNILLLGIKACYYDENDEEIIDPEAIKKKMKQDKRKPERQMMINPTEPNEKAYRTDGNDKLIVLARSGKVIEELEG